VDLRHRREVRDGTVGSGTEIQAGRSLVQFPMGSFIRPLFDTGIDSTSKRNAFQGCLLGVKNSGVYG
jgi:hypothetical protein